MINNGKHGRHANHPASKLRQFGGNVSFDVQFANVTETSTNIHKHGVRKYKDELLWFSYVTIAFL